MRICEEFYHVLSAMAPAFEHSVEDISFITSPQNFHSTILDLIRSSKERLIISSLYIGCSDAKGGTLSKEIIASLRERLSTVENEKFHLKITVEGTRSSRLGDDSTFVLNRLKKEFPLLQITVQPIFAKTRGIVNTISCIFNKLPGYDEIASDLLHMKYLISDDVVLMTGANLSEEYFTTRKDRYVMIKNATALAGFYSDLTTIIIDSNQNLYTEKVRLDSKNRLLDMLRLNTEFQSPLEYKNDKIYLFPSLQIPYLGIRHEEAVITTLLGMARKLNLSIHLCTAYFNIAPKIKQFLTGAHFSPDEKPSPISLLTSSPMCNSFFLAPWPKNLIPEIYETILQQFTSEVKTQFTKVFQYHRPGWTFHAKGLFLSKNNSIFLTQLGSSNYGFYFVTSFPRRSFL